MFSKFVVPDCARGDFAGSIIIIKVLYKNSDFTFYLQHALLILFSTAKCPFYTSKSKDRKKKDGTLTVVYYAVRVIRATVAPQAAVM